MKLTRSQATTILNTMLEYLAAYDDPKTFPPHEYHDLYTEIPKIKSIIQELEHYLDHK